MASPQGTVVGIDLGTTFSVLAYLDHKGAAVTIQNREGDPLTPSVIYLEGNRAVVGRAGKRAAAVDSSKAAMFVKRDMGKPLYSRLVAGRQFGRRRFRRSFSRSSSRMRSAASARSPRP